LIGADSSVDRLQGNKVIRGKMVGEDGANVNGDKEHD
jgi:hypothetical protein